MQPRRLPCACMCSLKLALAATTSAVLQGVQLPRHPAGGGEAPHAPDAVCAGLPAPHLQHHPHRYAPEGVKVVAGHQLCVLRQAVKACTAERALPSSNERLCDNACPCRPQARECHAHRAAAAARRPLICAAARRGAPCRLDWAAVEQPGAPQYRVLLACRPMFAQALARTPNALQLDMVGLEPRLLQMGAKVVDFGCGCWTDRSVSWVGCW